MPAHPHTDAWNAGSGPDIRDTAEQYFPLVVFSAVDITGRELDRTKLVHLIDATAGTLKIYRQDSTSTAEEDGDNVIKDSNELPFVKVREVGLTGMAAHATGTFSGRDAYDDETSPRADGTLFVYLSSDGDGDAVEDAVLFVKLSSDSADWSDAILVRGAIGPAAEDPAIIGDETIVTSALNGDYMFIQLLADGTIKRINKNNFLSGINLTLALQEMKIADLENIAQFMGSAGNRFADSFDALTYVDTGGATNLDSSEGGVLKPTETTPTPSYGNAGGTGGRTGSITVGASSGLLSNTASNSNLVDGGTNTNTADSTFFTTAMAAAGVWISFDFAAPKLITEAKWYQHTTAPHGTWKWQGSDDASLWVDIGVSFTLGGATTQTQTTLSGNSTFYRYYRLLGISGTTNGSPWLQEVEFKIAAAATANDLAVTSTSLTAAVAPTRAVLVALVEETVALTFNTDFIMSASRDGSTYTASTLNERFTTGGLTVVESDELDISGQPSGTAIRWKIASANNKAFKVHAVYIFWF